MSTSPVVTRCSRPEAGWSITASAALGTCRRCTTHASRGEASAGTSPSASCSQTVSCTRSATSSRQCRTRASRRGTWRACASTTRSTLRAGSATSKPTGTVRSKRRARARTGVAPVHGGRRGRVRTRPQPGASDPGDQDGRRQQRDAAATRLRLALPGRLGSLAEERGRGQNAVVHRTGGGHGWS